jgi:TRAP-type C4-dicarboxylate transport system substrate-binding protein
MREELEAMNQRIAIFDFYGETKMWSANKPLNTLANLDGEKIRVSAAYEGVIAAVGAVPVSMTSPETYEALQRGVVEGCVLSLDAAVKYHYSEVCKYGADMWHISAGATPLVTINNDTYSKLPKEYQDLVMEVGEEAARYFNELYVSDMSNNWATLKEGGLERLSFSDAEIEKWRDMPEAQALKDEWVDKANERGYPGREMMDTYLQCVEEAKQMTKSPPLP